jgi:hypothetical protein
MGFIHELVQANRKSPFWTLWSTAPADASSIQYLQQAVKETKDEDHAPAARRLVLDIVKIKLSL